MSLICLTRFIRIERGVSAENNTSKAVARTARKLTAAAAAVPFFKPDRV